MIYWLSLPVPLPTLGMIAWWMIAGSCALAVFAIYCAIHDVRHEAAKYLFHVHKERCHHKPNLNSDHPVSAKGALILVACGPFGLALALFALYVAIRMNERRIYNAEWARRKRIIDGYTSRNRSA